MPVTTKVDHAEATIRDLIARGAEGERLPRESDLADLAGVSRMTVREALSRLWLEGLIVRRWGAGTYIAERGDAGTDTAPFRSIYAAIHGITSLPEEIERAGHRVELTAFQVAQGAVPGWVRDAVPDAGIHWRVRRCLLVDGRPAVVMFDYLPERVRTTPLNPTALADVSVDLMSFLRGYGLRIVKHESTINAVTVDADVADLLDLPADSPVLRARQQAISDSGVTAGCGEFFYNDDVFATVLVRTTND